MPPAGSGKKKKSLFQGQKTPFTKRLLRAVPVFLGAFLLTLVGSRAGFLRGLETYALDTMMRLQAPPTESDVAIVYIDDADYEKMFQGKSPLDSARLLELIQAIARGRPKVIGVDIETRSDQFREFETPQGLPPIVWAQDGVFSNREGKYHLFNVLGRKNSATLSGPVVLKLDSDGAVRHYTRLIATQKEDLPSFTWAVVSEYLPDKKTLNASKDELLIRFAGDPKGSHRVRLTASRVLDISDGQGWQSNSPIKDKIVLLGGAYAASDEHATPVGWMLGVEVLAYSIETELQGGGIRPPRSVDILALGVLAGLALCLLFQHFSVGKALLLSIAAVPLLSIACSLVAFRSTAYWVYFVPVLIALLSQQVFEQAKDYRRKIMNNLYQTMAGTPADANNLIARQANRLKSKLWKIDKGSR